MPCHPRKKMAVFYWRLAGKKPSNNRWWTGIFADVTPQEDAIVNDAIQNIMFCKNAYKNLYNAVADCLPQSFNYMDKEHLKKMMQIDD